ncbi:hypothetical protein F5Y15DRAFT_125340 [Xylariaceae sp. FL0016]|nr:hypothetical protein F5Y15DRAFT_125340 [Xylariaceae sp. FL0016]
MVTCAERCAAHDRSSILDSWGATTMRWETNTLQWYRSSSNCAGMVIVRLVCGSGHRGSRRLMLFLYYLWKSENIVDKGEEDGKRRVEGKEGVLWAMCRGRPSSTLPRPRSTHPIRCQHSTDALHATTFRTPRYSEDLRLIPHISSARRLSRLPSFRRVSTLLGRLAPLTSAIGSGSARNYWIDPPLPVSTHTYRGSTRMCKAR